MKTTKEEIGGRTACIKDLSEIIRVRVDQLLVGDEQERSTSHRTPLALASVLLAALNKIVHDAAPSSANELWVVGSQIGLADGEARVRLASGGFLGEPETFPPLADSVCRGSPGDG